MASGLLDSVRKHAVAGFKNQSSYIRKAFLDSSPNSGGAFETEALERKLTNAIPRLAPDIAVLGVKQWKSDSYQFNQRTGRPAGNRAQGETGASTSRSSTNKRVIIPFKIIRGKAQITNFLDETAVDFDVVADEMNAHLETQAYDIIAYNYFGNSDASTYEYRGIENVIKTYREDFNGNEAFSLEMIDDLIDSTKRKGNQNHDRVLVMAPELVSLLSRLIDGTIRNGLDKVGNTGLREVYIGAGHHLIAYRGIPIIESQMVNPIETMTNPTPSTNTSGGTIADGNNFIRLSVFTIDGGEQFASAEQSQATAGGNTSTITLDFTPFPGAHKYRVYWANVSNGPYTAITEVQANTYGSDGEITSETNQIVLTSTVPDTTIRGSGDFTNTVRENDQPFLAADEGHSMFLWDLHPFQGMGRFCYTHAGGSAFNGLVSMKELAQTDDWLNFLVKTYGGLIPALESTSGYFRNFTL